MRRRSQLVALAVAVAAVASFAVSATSGAAAPTAPVPPPPSQRQPHLGAADVVSPNSGTLFKAVTPCRIADTRATTALTPAAPRNFTVSGTTGFVPQGGHSGGCAIPAAATAITATLTAVSAHGGGFLRAWARGQAEPSATTLNYTSAFNVGVGAVIPVSATGMTVQAASSATGLVVDVTGYYVPPISLVTYSDGTVVSQSRLTSVTHTSTGYWTLVADVNVSQCAVSALSFGTFYANGFTSGNTIYLQVHNLNTAPPALADAYFQMTMDC